MAAAPALPPGASAPPAGPPLAPADGPSWTVMVGIMLGLGASVGINLGNNLQSHGLHLMADRGLDRRPLIWKIGAATFGIASLINFGAFGFAPAAVLAPLESIQFVTNLIFGKFVNNAHITQRMVAGSMLIVGGCVVTVIFGPNRVAKFSVQELSDFWAETLWIMYLSFLVGFAGTAQLVHARLEAARIKKMPYKHDAVILPVTFAVSSAIIGSMCVVMSKCMSELVEIFVTEGADVLASALFYISLVLTVVFLCGWLYRLNAALGKYDPLFIIPLLQANYILFSILSGGVYFQEFGMLDLKQWILFVTGIVVMFCGLFLLAPKQQKKQESGETDESPSGTSWEPSPPESAPARLSGTRRKPFLPVDSHSSSPPPEEEDRVEAREGGREVKERGQARKGSREASSEGATSTRVAREPREGELENGEGAIRSGREHSRERGRTGTAEGWEHANDRARSMNGGVNGVRGDADGLDGNSAAECANGHEERPVQEREEAGGKLNAGALARARAANRRGIGTRTAGNNHLAAPKDFPNAQVLNSSDVDEQGDMDDQK